MTHCRHVAAIHLYTGMQKHAYQVREQVPGYSGSWVEHAENHPDLSRVMDYALDLERRIAKER